MINKKLNNYSMINVFIKFMLAACVAGVTMSLLNVLVDIILGNTIFRFSDIIKIALYHVLVWSVFGILMGIIYSFYMKIRKKKLILDFISISYAYILFALIILVVGYMNVYFFPLVRSTQTILYNILFFIIGIILFVVVTKNARLAKALKVFRLYVATLLVILISSLVYNSGKSVFSNSNTRIQNNIQLGSDYFNVVVVSLDAVRPDHLGCYGYEKNTSPNIDKIASKGLIFENAFAHSSHTRESVPSLFTSTYPSTHNVKLMTESLPKGIITIPEIFKWLGYRTSIFTVAGFIDEAHGYKKGVDGFFSRGYNINQATILYQYIKHINDMKIPGISWISFKISKLGLDLLPAKRTLSSSDPMYITNEVISWITVHKDQPFFIYLHYLGAHAPYNPPPPYNKMFDPDYVNDSVTNYPNSAGRFLPFMEGNSISNRELRNMVAQYDGEIYYHDTCLGTLFKYLKDLDLYEKTIVFITSDHGEEFYDHKCWGHGQSLYDELIKVPFIIYCPGLIPENKRINEIVSHVDAMPTLLSLCGISNLIEIPYDIEGIDLVPIFSAEQDIQRNYVIAELNQGGNYARCIRTKDYKAMKINYGTREIKLLFNLSTDTNEKINIYDGANKSELAGHHLFEKMDITLNKAAKRSFKTEKTIIDKKTKERLKALGYIK